MEECSVLKLKEKISDSDAYLIDVRERAEFAAGRVPEAKLIPLGKLASRHNELDRERTIYIMCRSGRRSAEAYKILISLGFSSLVNVAGGFDAWKKADLEFERDEKAPWSLERQVRFTAGSLVFIGVILSLLVHPYFIALAGFVGFGLTFTAVIDWCGMGLLLAKMPWNKNTV